MPKLTIETERITQNTATRTKSDRANMENVDVQFSCRLEGTIIKTKRFPEKSPVLFPRKLCAQGFPRIPLGDNNGYTRLLYYQMPVHRQSINRYDKIRYIIVET